MAGNRDQVIGSLLVLGLLAGGAYWYDASSQKPSAKSDVTPSPPPTDDDTGDAEEIVLETIDTPSTAHFVSSRVLATEGVWRMVNVVLDAQNHFGAMLRKSLCVTYFRDGKKIRWSQQFGVQECSREPTQQEITLLKGLNNWGELNCGARGQPCCNSSGCRDGLTCGPPTSDHAGKCG